MRPVRPVPPSMAGPGLPATRLMQPPQGMPPQGMAPAMRGGPPVMQGGMPNPRPPQAQMPMAPGGQPPVHAQPVPAEQLVSPPKEQILRKIQAVNIAADLDEDKLAQIGDHCKKGYDADERSRKDWLDETAEWMGMAQQIREIKTFPWPEASNIKYPLISTAAMQFAARAYPSLIPGDGKIVKMKVIGRDPTGNKTEKANNTADYMSWQLLFEMPSWDEDTDKLLNTLPIVGTMFRKVFFDKTKGKNTADLVYPDDLCVNYWAKSLDDAERVSEIIMMTKRKIQERIRTKEFLDVDLGDPPVPADAPDTPLDHTTPYKIIAQSTWLDLDDDDIEEPYTVVFDYDSGKVLRIAARFTPDDILVSEEGELIGFNAQNHYIKYTFIPNPDGGFYDFGFGHLLGPLNESVNTLINQLLDSGTLANLQAGFVGKGLRLKMGEAPLRPGEWRGVNVVGDDIRKQMVPLPVTPPQPVLFQLLGMLIQSGEKLASVAEIFTGKMPGQNTPATTTMATIEQGMKVFTAIYKRVYRSMEKEFKLLFYLNGEYLNPNSYSEVLDIPVDPKDFDTKLYDIMPAADPAASSQQEQLMKAQALLELLPSGRLDPTEVVIRVLKAQQQPDWERLIPGMAQTGKPQIPQQPDPKQQEMQLKMQAEAQKSQLKQAEGQQKLQLKGLEGQQKLAMQKATDQTKQQGQLAQMRLDAQAAKHKQQIFMRDSVNKMRVSDAQHKQKLRQVQEMPKSKPKKGTQTKTSTRGK